MAFNKNNCSQSKSKEIFKSSGATYKKITEGNFKGFFFVSAWKATKNGLITATCFPRSLKSGSPGDKNRSPTGQVSFDVEFKDPITNKKEIKTYARYRVDVKQGINVQTYYTFMNLETRKIVIKELNMVITPNGTGRTRSGKKVSGYFGKNYKD